LAARWRIPPAAAQLVIKRSGMDDVLLGIVLQRLKGSPLEEQTSNLLLAAFESEESMSAQLGGKAAERPSGDRAVVTLPEPAGAYLRSLTVSGFRGDREARDPKSAARSRADRARRSQRQREVQLR
jgi:hypothetical protein